MKEIKHCLLLETGNENRNGRVYSKEVIDDFIKRNGNESVIGCLTDDRKSEYTDLINVTHKINGIKLEGDSVFGDVSILDTPKGNLVQYCMDNGFSVEVRPVGIISEDDKVTITGFDLETKYDINK